MPTIDGSRDLVSAGADYSAGDWASVGVDAGLDLLAVADLNRGIDLGLGVEALANLEGSIRKYLAADLSGQAHAAARVRAQVQIPLDLFDESGIAVRLQAVAEAAVGVQLAIGLSVDDFLGLAAQDERLKGAPLQLLKVFLEEFSIQGGVMAKAAAAAMAYANVVATGSLIKKGQRKPGFTVAAEAGVGLKAGAGFRVFARFSVDDPRRLIRRSVDVAVSETLNAIGQKLPRESRGMLDECAVVLRIGFRCAFEIGEALVTHPGSAPTLSMRAVQVTMEELQRYVLESALRFASRQLSYGLANLNFGNAGWNAALPHRETLIARLQALPAEPFEANSMNLAYWGAVVDDALSLASALNCPPEASLIMEPLAVLWCSVQLLMKSVERISVAQARASVIGAPTVGTMAAFTGDLSSAPAPLRAHINKALGHGGDPAVTQQDAVSYLLKALSYRIELVVPGSAGLLSMLTGKGKLDEALSIVLSNIGAFATAANGTVNAQASLAIVQKGLRAYIDIRLQEELAPLLEQATAGRPELRVYMNEVLLGTLRTMVSTVLDELRAVSAGGGIERALREMCSALLMRLFGRSLVVAVDVLTTQTLVDLQAQFRVWARHANDTGGAVPVLAGLTGLKRDFVNDLVVETLEVCAETFAPMSQTRRARMRDLLYQMIDTMPPAAGKDTLASLKTAGMVGNAEAALELAQLLGEQIASNLVRFIQALLAHAARALLAALTETIEDIQRAVEAWVEGLKAVSRELVAALARFSDEIARIEDQIDDAVDGVFAQLSTLLGGFAGHSASRSAIRTRIKDAFNSRALDALSGMPGYGSLPIDVRQGIRSTVSSLVNNVLDASVVDAVVDVLQQVSGQTADLLDDLRAIEPGDDFSVALADCALDRIEAGLRAGFDRKPYIRLSFDAPVIGPVDLGRIEVPIGSFVGAVRGVVRSLGLFDEALQSAAPSLERLFALEGEHAAAVREREASKILKDEADTLVVETSAASVDLHIVSPQSGALATSTVTVRLRLSGVCEAALRDDGLSRRRLYLWINGREVEVAAARLQVAPSIQHAVPVVSKLAGSGFTHVLPATARLQRQASEMRLSTLPASSRLPGAANSMSTRFSVGPMGPLLSGAPMGTLPALDMEIDIPADLIHQGINTIACALVPGPRQRRIERAVSFLVTPPSTPGRGRPPIPSARVPTVMADFAGLLQAGGAYSTAGAKGPVTYGMLEHAAWSLPRNVLNDNINNSRVTIKRQLEGRASILVELHRRLAEGQLPPNGSVPGTSDQSDVAREKQ